MYKDLELSEVVTAAQGGEGNTRLEAFGELVRRFQDMAVGYAYSLLGDEDLAQDAAQEAFVQLYLHLNSVQDPAAIAGWFKKVVFSCCHRMIRRKKAPTLDIDEARNLPGNSPEPDQVFERKTMRQEIVTAIQSLPETQRSVLILHIINEFSYKQIADFLDLPESTVNSRLSAARRNIKKELWHMVENNLKGIAVSGDDRFVKKILREVPRLGFGAEPDGAPEDIPVASVIKTVLKTMGDDYGRQGPVSNGMVFFSGVSGAVFRFFWRFLERENGGIDPAYMVRYGDQQFARSFEAAGYRYELHLSPAFGAQIGWTGPLLESEAETRRRILSSIRDHDRPVIGFGVIGIATSEPCIIHGYDDNGAVLIGWSFHQNEQDRNLRLEFEPTGYFRKRGWYPETFGILTIGERVAKPPAAEVYRKALAWGVEQMRLSEIDGYPAGWAAYQEWADAMTNAANFPADPEILQQRASYIDPVIWELAERRWYATEFIGQILERFPNLPKDDLVAARNHFQAEHDLMWEVFRLSGMKENQLVKGLGDADTREKIAAVILKAREQNIAAAEHLEKTLALPDWG